MNGIFGLFYLDQAPVASEKLAAMQAGMSLWDTAHAASWRAGEVGLGCLPLRSTPEAASERLPLHHHASGLTLTAGARLDYRAELLQQLFPGEGCSYTHLNDAEIILNAYLRWGVDCVSHLEGDWHFAIWNQKTHRLFLARDQHGNTGLYYFHSPKIFAFASLKKGLLALDEVPKNPDLLRIAQVLTSWPGDGLRTGYENILRLPPAHRMTISPQSITTDQYWSPEPVTPLHLESDEQYVEAFIEVFTQAVSSRLRGQRSIGVTLSGGLDSGSVAAVAARLAQNRGARLLAFTTAPRSDPAPYINPARIGDETDLAQATAGHAGNVDHILLRAENITPLEGIKRMLAIHDEPGHAASNQYWIAALLAAAREQDVGVLLTGQMGNTTISWAGGGEQLYPLLLRGDVAGFRRSFEKARRNAGLTHWRAARRFLLKPLVLPLWLEYQQRFQPRQAIWMAYSAIRADYARSIKLSQQMAIAGYHPWMGSSDPVQQRLQVIQPGRNILGASWLEKGAAFGLEVRDPTQDRRVIELCLAIPDRQFQRNGVDRWLIRRAMQGYLPDEVRLNTRRGLQAADLGQRVLADRSSVDRALNQLGVHDLASEVLDLPRMTAVLASMNKGLTVRNTSDCSTILMPRPDGWILLIAFLDYLGYKWCKKKNL